MVGASEKALVKMRNFGILKRPKEEEEDFCAVARPSVPLCCFAVI